MTENDRLITIEKKLDEHGRLLANIQQTLSLLAVQKEQIANTQRDVHTLWVKWDSLTDPKEGALTTVQRFQASCPREQIKHLWIIVVPMGLVLLGQAVALFALFSKVV